MPEVAHQSQDPSQYKVLHTHYATDVLCTYTFHITTAANPPTGLMAVQDSLTSILVSWTAPASGGASHTSYRIFNQTGGGSEQSVTVGPTATSHTLTGLQSGATYSISIVARSNQLPSARVGPEMVVTVKGELMLCIV